MPARARPGEGPAEREGVREAADGIQHGHADGRRVRPRTPRRRFAVTDVEIVLVGDTFVGRPDPAKAGI